MSLIRSAARPTCQSQGRGFLSIELAAADRSPLNCVPPTRSWRMSQRNAGRDDDDPRVSVRMRRMHLLLINRSNSSMGSDFACPSIHPETIDIPPACPTSPLASDDVVTQHRSFGPDFDCLLAIIGRA